jgi:hypothetical protein
MDRPKPVNDALAEGLRGLGRSITPEQLLNRGIRKVRALSIEQVSKLVERAVNKTLIERTLPLSDDERQELLSDAQVRLRSTLRTQLELQERKSEIHERKQDLIGSMDQAGIDALDLLLRRRLKKAIDYLEETEGAIESILERLDSGLPSHSHPSAGISRKDPARYVKRRLLTGILRDNRSAAEGEAGA